MHTLNATKSKQVTPRLSAGVVLTTDGNADGTAHAFGGGVVGYAGLTPQERLARQKHAKTLGTSAVAVIFKDALQTEAEGFTNILATRGGMSPKQIADWFLHPPVILGEKKADKLMTEIKLQTVRVVVTASVGGELSDKDW